MAEQPPIRHLRRVLANRSECDEDDDRVFADGPADCTCQACIAAYERRALDWHRELAERPRPAQRPVTGVTPVPTFDTSDEKDE